MISVEPVARLSHQVAVGIKVSVRIGDHRADICLVLDNIADKYISGGPNVFFQTADLRHDGQWVELGDRILVHVNFKNTHHFGFRVAIRGKPRRDLRVSCERRVGAPLVALVEPHPVAVSGAQAHFLYAGGERVAEL